METARFVAYPRTLCFILGPGKDAVLLLKGAPHKRLYANLLNGVGGHVERDEDVLSSLQREVREETGLEIDEPALRAVIVADEGAGPGVLIFVYMAHSESKVTRPSTEGDLVWAPLADLDRLDLVPDLRDLLPRILGGSGGLLYSHYAADGTRAWRQ